MCFPEKFLFVWFFCVSLFLFSDLIHFFLFVFVFVLFVRMYVFWLVLVVKSSVCQERKHRAESDMCTEAEKGMQNCSFSQGDRLPCMDNECYAQKVVARGSQHMQNLSYLK